MSTEITEEGYQDIATHVVVGLWKYAELQTSSGTPLVRRVIADNTNTYWKDTTLPAYVLETTVTGQDTDIPELPFVIGKFALFKTTVDTVPSLVIELPTEQRIAARTDKVVIDVTINIPEGV